MMQPNRFPATAQNSVTFVPPVHRNGFLPARVGAEFPIRTTVAMRASAAGRGGTLRPGVTVVCGVRPLHTATAEALEVMKWACTHRSCVGRHWASKEAMFADHQSHEELINAAQAHVYVAVAELAYEPGKPAKRDADGNVVEPATPPRGFVELYTDEI